jgi:hypothetical protein
VHSSHVDIIDSINPMSKTTTYPLKISLFQGNSKIYSKNEKSREQIEPEMQVFLVKMVKTAM